MQTGVNRLVLLLVIPEGLLLSQTSGAEICSNAD